MVSSGGSHLLVGDADIESFLGGRVLLASVWSVFVWSVASLNRLEASFVVKAHHGGSIRSQKLSRICIQLKKKLTLKVQLLSNSLVHGDLYKDWVGNAKKSAEELCALSSLIMGHMRNAGEKQWKWHAIKKIASTTTTKLRHNSLRSTF